jgi:hypothetical protein
MGFLFLFDYSVRSQIGAPRVVDSFDLPAKFLDLADGVIAAAQAKKMMELRARWRVGRHISR